MASTGTQTTWSSNGSFYLKIRWDITSQSVANNRSVVRVRMYIGAKSGWALSDTSNSWTLGVASSNFSGGANININGNESLIADEQVSIDHNSDGTKNIAINGAISGLYFGGINPPSFTASLNAIPRASSISSTASLNADSNSSIGVARYSSGFSHTLDIYLTKSGVADKYIKQLSYSSSVTSRSTAWDSDDRYEMFRYGHGYWTGTRLVLKTYSGGTLIGTTEKTGSFTYPSNNSVGAISGFTLGNNAQVSISKASDLYAHQIELRIGSTVIGSNGISTAESFSIPINTTNVLNSITTSKTGTVVLSIKTYLASDPAVVIRDWTNEATATVTIPASYAPSFASTQFTYADMNGTTTGITGNNQVIVSGLSTLQVNINSNAVATTGASITGYTVSAGGKSGSRTGTGAVLLNQVSTTATTMPITVTATDSRGYQTTATKTASVIPYSKPTVVGNATRNGGFEETTILRTSGVVSRLVVGGTAKNNITALQYRTKLSTASWGTTWDPIPFTAPTGTNTTYSASNVSLTIPSLEVWNIEVKATDTMGNETSVIYTVSAGVPLVFMDTTLNSLGIGMFPVGSNELRVAGKVAGSSLSAGNHTIDSDGLFGGGTSFIKKSGDLLVLNDGGFNTGGIQLTGDTTITGAATINSGAVTSRLNHSSGYFVIQSFSTGSYGEGQAEFWYRGDERKLTIASRNPGDPGAKDVNVYAAMFLTPEIRTASTATDLTLGVNSSKEVKIMQAGATSTYRPCRASAFPTSSSINYKTNLEEVGTRVDALELIKDTDIWHYHLKSNLEGGIYDKPKVGVISEMVNPLIRDEDGVDPYSMVSLAWKAIQQQDEKIQAQALEIEDLKAQNALLFDMMQQLESRLSDLEQK